MGQQRYYEWRDQTEPKAQPEPRSLAAIAREIRANWKKMSPYAKPYADAMLQLEKITDRYGADDARGIVLYFLSNAGAWRGDTAKRIKAELRAILGHPRGIPQPD